jgi:hypothetical protein
MASWTITSMWSTVSDMVNTMFSHAFGILNVFTCIMWTFLFFKCKVDDVSDVFTKLVLLALSALSVMVAFMPLINSIIH